MADPVRCTIDEHVAHVRLNRPDKLNALELATFDALIEAGEALKADRSVRAVVLSGEGRSFCAGLDTSLFAAMAHQEGAPPGTPSPAGGGGTNRLFEREPGRISNRAQHAVYVWAEMPAPVIAAVHGHALGGGLQLAVAADIRIVAPDATLSALEIRWGLVPDMTGTQLLPRLVGVDVAKEMAFTGRMVSGEEAFRIGLATHLSTTPLDDALALASQIAGRSPDAVRGAKALIDHAGRIPLADGLLAEERTARGLTGTPNQVEAIMSYLERRAPRFME